MNNENLISAVEAVLFAGGEPVSINRLCQVFEKDPKTIKAALQGLQERLDGTGIQLVQMEDSYQLSSRKQFGDYIKIAFDLKRKQPLSQAAFEVLAVVAYNQPVTKAFIEQVRGVDCSGVVSTLVDGEKVLLEKDSAKTVATIRTMPLSLDIKERLLEIKMNQDNNTHLCHFTE